MVYSIKKSLWMLSGLLLVFGACTHDSSNDTVETVNTEQMPAEMPDDFYIAVREMGGSEPYDNVYYLSVDSASREAYYYDFHSVNSYQPERKDVEAIYQKIYAAAPWNISETMDSVNRVYDRGGELFEIGMKGCKIARSNAENSHISKASVESFQGVLSPVRNEVIGRLQSRLQAVSLQITYKDHQDPVTMVRVNANDFPLLVWEGSGKAEAPPATGKNAVLPGDYHVNVFVKTESAFYSAQDTLRVEDRGRQLGLEVFDGGVEIKKLY